MIDDDDKKCGFFSLQFGISSSDGTKRQRDILRSSVRLALLLFILQPVRPIPPLLLFFRV
jgi:hypothetical protein